MPKLNTTVKSVRIDNDILSELESRIDCSFNSWLNSVIADYIGGKPQNQTKSDDTPSDYDGVNPRILANIKQMCPFLGTSFSGMMEMLSNGLDDGSLSVVDGRLKGETEVNLDGFYEVCHEKNLDLQKAIDKAVAMLWK